MNFRTTLTLPSFPFSIDHSDRLFSIGSCFAEHIGQRLNERKFSLLSNPYGILYNPASITTALEMLLENYQFSEKDFFQHQELWHSYHHHGEFSNLDLAQATDNIQQQISIARTQLLRTNRLLLTLGTSRVYILKKLEKVVANCHKLPQKEFINRRLSIAETVAFLQPTLEKLKSQNPDLQIIITISPIRHWRDGAIENQRSKAVLLLATELICKNLDYVHYFPAYELVMDDLRDYRFYKKDMTHPNELAQEYIWNQFQKVFFDKKTQQLNQRIEKLIAAKNHRPLHPQTNAHQQFRQAQLKKAAILQQEHPQLDCSDIIDFFKN
ncbi:MAG: GSCFA domain-containing protein [Saprospiraceae bacterium]